FAPPRVPPPLERPPPAPQMFCALPVHPAWRCCITNGCPVSDLAKRGEIEIHGASSAGRQLRLLAHPNPVVKVTIDPRNVDSALRSPIEAFTKTLHEVCGVLVGSNDNARTYVFLRDEKIDLGFRSFRRLAAGRV